MGAAKAPICISGSATEPARLADLSKMSETLQPEVLNISCYRRSGDMDFMPTLIAYAVPAGIKIHISEVFPG
jgi:hypothetical protein